jgi:uncharacterized OB-fold protein
MRVLINDLDHENRAFYQFCAQRELRFQQCVKCGLKRYPPTSACPWCSELGSSWEPVSGLGTLYSYGEVHHAIMPVFREYTPYMLLLVELDEQRDQPNKYDGLRMNGNLAKPDGSLAGPELVAQVGIGTRLKVVFKAIGEGIALPLWAIDDTAVQPEQPWRYPEQ